MELAPSNTSAMPMRSLEALRPGARLVVSVLKSLDSKLQQPWRSAAAAFMCWRWRQLRCKWPSAGRFGRSL